MLILCWRLLDSQLKSFLFGFYQIAKKRIGQLSDDYYHLIHCIVFYENVFVLSARSY